MGFILKLKRLETVIRVPIDHAITLAQRKLDQTTTAGTTCTGTSIGHIGCPVRGTQQPLPCIVKKTARLVVHLHRHMRAAIQIGMDTIVVTNGEGLAALACVDHIKSNRTPTMVQRTALAQGNRADRNIRHACPG